MDSRWWAGTHESSCTSDRTEWMYAEPPFAVWGKIPRNKGWKAYALTNMNVYVFGGSDSGDLATIHQFECGTTCVRTPQAVARIV